VAKLRLRPKSGVLPLGRNFPSVVHARWVAALVEPLTTAQGCSAFHITPRLGFQLHSCLSTASYGVVAATPVVDRKAPGARGNIGDPLRKPVRDERPSRQDALSLVPPRRPSSVARGKQPTDLLDPARLPAPAGPIAEVVLSTGRGRTCRAGAGPSPGLPALAGTGRPACRAARGGARQWAISRNSYSGAGMAPSGWASVR
jgi:hypothetical protein